MRRTWCALPAGLAQATDSILSKDAEDADTAGRNLLAELTAFVDGPSSAKAASISACSLWHAYACSLWHARMPKAASIGMPKAASTGMPKAASMPPLADVPALITAQVASIFPARKTKSVSRRKAAPKRKRKTKRRKATRRRRRCSAVRRGLSRMRKMPLAVLARHLGVQVGLKKDMAKGTMRAIRRCRPAKRRGS